MDPNWWRLYHRLAVAYRPHRPESTFKGTALCLLRHHFKQEKQWLVVPEALLREIAEEQLLPSIGPSPPGSAPLPSQESNEQDEGEDEGKTDQKAKGEGQPRDEGASEEKGDSGEEYGLNDDSMELDHDHEPGEVELGDDEEMDFQLELGTAEDDYTYSSGDEDGNGRGGSTDGPTHPSVSMDSQGLITYEERRKANRPDFILSKFGGALFKNQTHLYVEVKNGSTRHTAHTKQLMRYIDKISKAIPPGFLVVHRDVVLMLIDAGTTHYWRITPKRVNDNRRMPIWEWAEQDDTLGDRISEILIYRVITKA